MSFMSDYRKALKKLQNGNESKKTRKKEEETVTPSSFSGSSESWSSFMSDYRNELKRLQKENAETAIENPEELAPVFKAEEKVEDKKWYESGLFEDGYDFGDVTKTILGISDKKELKTFSPVDTTDSLDVLKQKQEYLNGRTWNTADQTAEALKATQQYNQQALYEYSQTLSKTKMDGTNHTVLEEIEILANMKNGKEKDARKAKVLSKMEELGMDSSFYSHFAGDGEFDFDTFGKWLYNASMAGLNTFNKGLLDTADVLIGAPMKAMGWEDNPISKGAEYYNTLYSGYRYNADILAEKLGGNAWNFGSDAVEGTVGALPNALLMFMTGGASGTATTSSLMNNAAMQTGNILTKAGLTAETMMKNPQFWMSFSRTLGSEYQQAKEDGASDTAAAIGSVLSSMLQSGLEIGLDGGSGIQGLPDGLKSGKPLMEWVESSLEEGGEEVLQKFVGEMISKFGYGSDKEILNPIEYAKEGTLGVISGAALGGGQTAVTSGINTFNEHQANKLTDIEKSVKDKIVQKQIAKKEKDGKTLTAKEKAAIEEEVERNLRKGYLSADDIEEAIGGESYDAFKAEQKKFFASDEYQNYRKETKDSKKRIEQLQNQLKKLENEPNTVGNAKKYDAIQNRIEVLQKRTQQMHDNLLPEAERIMGMKSQMRSQMMGTVKDSRLAETYREMDRKREKFQVDVSKYTNENAKKTVQSILDSGLGDNSNQFHETVEWLAKLSEDRNVTFDLTNNAKLKGTKHHRDGYITNGFVNDNGDIMLNMDSERVLNTTVGHEITHVLEKAGVYTELSKAVRDFAIAKEGQDAYNKRLADIKEIYGEDQTKIDSELTADIIGEYLFTDYEFVHNLSTSNRNVFQKIYDEIKYMVKIATAGSKEARELEKVKKMFDKAWRENVKGKSQGDVNNSQESVSESQTEAEIESEANEKYSIRKETPPEKTEKAYKLMRLVDGDLYPLFIGNNEKVSVGTWYNADSPNLSQLKDLPAGTHLVNMETGEAITWDEYAEQYLPKKNGQPVRSKPNKDDIHWANDNGYRFMHIEEKTGASANRMQKQYGDTRAYYNWGVNGSAKSETGEGSASMYALRPGWHFGEVPSMHQIGYGDNKDMRLDNQVWVEVDMSADVDYNEEAASNWGGDIPTHIPTDGYYKFATNPTQKKTKSGATDADNTKADWYVAGAFKVNRILSDAEADSIVNAYNQRTGRNVPLDHRRSGGRMFNAETMSVEDISETQNENGLHRNEEVQYSLSRDTEFSDKAIAKNTEKFFVDDMVLTEAKALRGRVADRMNEIRDKGLVGLPEDIEGNTYIANSSYDGTEENTTICPRSLASEAFVDAVSEYLGRPLTVEEQIYISQDLQGRSMTPECTYCYVATDRKAYRAFLGEYINQRDAVLEKLKANPNADTSKDGELYQEFLNGRKDTKPMYNRFQMWVKAYQNGTPMVEASHLANISKLMGDINSEFGAELKPQIVDAMKYAQSASWAKKRVNYVAYNGHILKWKQDRINKLNSHYGLRMYSFSDFHPAFVLENMQMITDASVRGLKMLGYTKDTDFVEIFAPSGMNINISTFGFESGGNVYENNIIGAEWAKAKKLREENPNVGITFVATNDTLVNWALDQDWIDVVIPYHLVRTGTEVAKAFGYTNYTSESADTKKAEWTKGDDKYIAPTKHNNDLETYFNELDANNLNPRFARFKDNPNYMKLVNECRQSASESKPVQPKFNEDAAMKALAKLESNGYYQPIGGSVDRMYEIASEVAEDMAKKIPTTQYSMTKDSDGRDLTDAQREFFKDSKIVDENGNLMTMYHGTKKGGFTVFNGGKDYWYFTKDKKYTDTFEGRMDNGEFYPSVQEGIDEGYFNPQKYEVYLNVTNPFVTDDIDIIEDAMYWDKTLPEQLRKQGYDALMLEDMSQVIVLNQNQIKNVDNTNPSSDPDIRYSMSKAEVEKDYQFNLDNNDMAGAEMAVEQMANLMMPDSKIRDKNGRLIPVYHGTNADFWEFDTSADGGKNGTAEGFGIYLSDNQDVTNAYGDRQIKMFANITKPATSFKKTIKTPTLVKLIKQTCERQAQMMVEEEGYDSIRDAIRDTWVSNYVDTYSTSMDMAYREVAQSMIQQNDNDKDIVHEVMFGMAIRSYDQAMDFYKNSLTPITGIDGFITKWDNANTGEQSNIYLAFDSSQLKSADAVTRDENGEVIPLSERFNPDKGDIRYSISKKGEGDDFGYVPSRDIGYHDEFDDFAPIREDVAKNDASAASDADAYKQKATADNVGAVGDNIAPTDDAIAPDVEEKKAPKSQKKSSEDGEEKTPAERRREKSKGYTDFWADLLGDTSTWVDMKTGLQYKTKTLRRILRKVVKDGRGNPDIGLADAIYDELETKYDHNEALLKRESARLKEVFQKLNLNNAEDQYAQMLGELRYNPETTLTEDVVKEFLSKHKGINEQKVNEAIKESRKLYDDLIVRVNEVLREQGFKEIPYRKGYFPHFTNPKQNWVQKLLNWKTIDTEIPTSIAGLTEMFKPNRSWQSFNKQRMGDKTDYSLYQGLDTYIHGALDWIYHIEDLQKRRSLENYIRYTHSEEGVKQKIDEILKGNYDADEAQTLINAVLDEANNPLSGLVRELMNRTNTLANKKSSMDRAMEDMLNRKIYSTMTNLNNRITSNMVVGSFSSALTNFIPMVQSWHQVSPVYTVKGMGDFVRSAIKDDGMIAKSDFLTNRLVEEEKLYKTGWDKASDKAAFMMNAVDNITSQTVWRSKYLQNLSEGMSEAQAIRDADQFAKNLMAGRSRGNAPTIFDAKNPLVKMFTAFQLEVANQYGYMFEDVPQDSKNMARLVKGYATAFLGAYAYNALYSSLVGRDAAFDPISIMEDLMKGLLDDEEEEEDVLMDFGKDILEEVPFVGGLMGGGRIPLSSAFPYSGYSNPIESALSDINEGKFSKEWLKPLYYLALPFGGGQIKKTNEGLGMFSDDHPISGSYTASGNLRFPVDDTFGNRVQAAMFGQYASENARDYFDNNRSALKPKQIAEFMESGMNIQDYWGYREGLKGLDSIGEYADYIDSLDLPIDKKNFLINGLTDRKTPIDMTDYGKYESYEEFNWASQNPEKYEFFKGIGISYSDYKNADEDTREDYNWAFEYPQYYTLSKAVTNDILEYRKYYRGMTGLKADKDANGKSISGSKKAKVIDYINGLDIEYGAKLVLLKSQYESVDEYNKEIFEYIRDKNNLSFEDKLSILKTLGFGVSDDGTVTWD